MKTIRTLAILFAFAGSAGCVSAAPKELVTARAAYDRAAWGPASTVDPTGLRTAKESLDAAEESFDNGGDTKQTRDLGYIAERQAQTADVRARAIPTTRQQEELAAQLELTKQALASQDEQLDGEIERRQVAEARAARATAALAKIALISVKQEPRGLVITLSGSILFTSGSSKLLPSARTKLNEVAEALDEQHPESKIVVEGYTDSQGSAASNRDLSHRRAKAVRDYLVSHRIASNRVTSLGFGEKQSIADNASAEGRANNRRVEIIVQPTK